MSRKDVELVIRARQEGGKAVESFTAALRDLIGAQDDLKRSGNGGGSVLAELGAEAAALGQQVKALREFSRVVTTLDKAAAAADDLAGKVATTRAELERLSASHHQVAAATAKAKAEAEAAAAAYERERQKATEVRKAAGATSDAYKTQAAAVAAAKTARDQANATLKTAESNERALLKSIDQASALLDEQSTAAKQAAAAWEELYEASASGSKGLGGVAASHDKVAEAAARAAEELRLAKGAIEFRQEADEAKRLREAASYIDWWTDALREKDALESEQAALAQGAMDFRRQADEAKRLREAASYIDWWTQALREKEAAEQAAQNTPAPAASGGQGGGGMLFGLRPYELHSLTYQINDVFTQLASGTPVMQVLAQQGGQLFQVFQRQLIPVFQRFGPVVAAAFPELILVAALIGAVVAAIKNIADQHHTLREFSGLLGASADEAQYNAEAIAEVAHQLDVMGDSLANARSSLKAFVKEGISSEFLEAFGRSAENFADVTGKEIPTAAKEMAEAFNGGYDDIVKLDEATNFLTASERKYIKALFDGGLAAKGRTEAFRIFNRQMDEGARNMRGPWSEALRNITLAWDNFLDWLENTGPIQGAIKLVGALAKAAKELTDNLPGAQQRREESAAIARGATPDMVRIEREITKLRVERAKAAEREAKYGGRGGMLTGDKPYNLRGDGPALVRTTAEIDADIQKREAALLALRQQANDTINEESQARQKVRDDVLSGIAREREALGNLTDERRVQLAGEEAYREAIRETGDVAIASAKKQIAIERELERQRQSINFDRLSGKIAGIESSGNANAKNGRSTATGLGQFIESTWLRLFREHFPAQAARLSEKAILDLRKDADLSRKMIELYARENAELLHKAGVSVNEAAVYLAHFLGPNGAVAVLRAAANTPVKALLGSDAIRANPEVLGGNKTAGDVRAYAAAKVGNSDDARAILDAEAAVAETILKNLREREKAQESLNDAIDDESKKRRQAAADAQATNGLTGVALINEQRRVFIAQQVEAAREKQREASEAEIRAGREALALDEARLKEVEASAAAQFDAQNKAAMLAARRLDSENSVNDIIEQRALLLEQIQLNQQLGAGGTALQLISEFETLNGTLDESIRKAVEFWKAIAGDPALMGMLGLTAQQVQNIVISLQNAGLNAKALGQAGMMTGAQINQSFANGATRAMDTFAQKIAAGENAFSSARDAFLQFAADFLRQIAQMILQQAILNLIGGALGGGNGGIGGAIVGAISKVAVPTRHEGGMAGNTGRKIWVPSSVFDDAQRYHGGGIAGLKPNEVPTILERNEEILDTDDPRHRFNLGGSGSSLEERIRIINAIDSGDLVELGLSTRKGEKAFMNFVRANASDISSSLGLS